MAKRIFCLILVVVILICISIPAAADYIPGYFDPSLPLTTEMIQSIYYSFQSILGLRGTSESNLSGNSSPSDIGLYTDINQWLTNTFLDFTISTLWNNIKNYFIQNGTITYSDGRTVPRWELQITNENVEDVKLFAKSIQDFQLSVYNKNLQSNYIWTDIDHIYGNYLSYASEFVSVYGYFYNSNADREAFKMNTPLNPYNGVFRSFGLDLYYNSGDTYIPIINFNPDNDTCVYLNNIPGIQTFYSSTASKFYYYSVFPITVNQQSNITLSLSKRNTSINNGINPNGNPGPRNYWSSLTLMSAAQYEDWLNTIDSSQYYTNYPSGISNIITSTSNNISSISTVSPGTYYIVAYLYQTGASPDRAFHKNTEYYFENSFDVSIGDSTTFGVAKVKGINRPFAWDISYIDPNTNTAAIITDGVSTVDPNAFEIGNTLYFPGYVPITNEYIDILNSDLTTTGEDVIPENPVPDNPYDDPVYIDITPPVTLNLASIWHYVADTYNYCVAFIEYAFPSILTYIPTPIYNLAFATVVLGIIFGLYKRFIE